MNHIEALKQALDALQGSGYYDTKQQREAITALRQAIQEAALQKLSDGLMRWSEQAKKREQWTPDDMAYRPGGLSMEDEPDLSEQGRNRSAVLGNNIQAMVDAGLPFLDALETTLKVYDHPTKPQEDTAYRPGGLSMEQKPVAWWNPDESGLAFQKLRGDWQPLYAAPVHAIDINKKCVDETAKDKHEPDVYGDGNVYRGQRSKDSTTKTLYYTDQEPVAWRTFDGEGNYEFRDYEMNEAYQEEWSKRNPKHQGWVEPLYAAPPKQEFVCSTGLCHFDGEWKSNREWQGLTDEEIFDVIRSLCADNETAEMLIDISMDEYRAIEAKLKEKNN